MLMSPHEDEGLKSGIRPYFRSRRRLRDGRILGALSAATSSSALRWWWSARWDAEWESCTTTACVHTFATSTQESQCLTASASPTIPSGVTWNDRRRRLSCSNMSRVGACWARLGLLLHVAGGARWQVWIVAQPTMSGGHPARPVTRARLRIRKTPLLKRYFWNRSWRQTHGPDTCSGLYEWVEWAPRNRPNAFCIKRGGALLSRSLDRGFRQSHGCGSCH